MTDYDLKEALRAEAGDLGFALFGVAPAIPPPHASAIHQWIDAGMHGSMAYLARDVARRCDPQSVMGGARSIIVVGATYAPPEPPTAPMEARFAAYALGDDYHDFMLPRLRQLSNRLAEGRGAAVTAKAYVDTGPLPEREYGYLAGLGWFGKNTMLIHPRLGSYFMLGIIVTDAGLPPDQASAGHCGTCTRCIDACPTGAIVAPYTVDARRCISYHTIESKDPVPAPIAATMRDRVFGCDICQEVCPFNRFAPCTGGMSGFEPCPAVRGAPLTDLVRMTEDEFRAAFKGSPVKRTKRRGLVRNAVAALSVYDDGVAIAAIERATTDPEPLVREQALQRPANH